MPGRLLFLSMTLTLLLLGFFAFLAGFIDSIVGGGGLIQMPAMLVLLPGVPVPTVFGTGKVSSLAGTLAALRRYLSGPDKLDIRLHCSARGR
jgi:uncharacterized membrane protein YfcA